MSKLSQILFSNLKSLQSAFKMVNYNLGCADDTFHALLLRHSCLNTSRPDIKLMGAKASPALIFDLQATSISNLNTLVSRLN